MDSRTLALYIQSCYTGSKLHWSATKDAKLISERGASFAVLIGEPLIEVGEHPKRPAQMLALVLHERYVWAIAFVVRDGEVFLKTAYPTRVETRRWRGEGSA